MIFLRPWFFLLMVVPLVFLFLNRSNGYFGSAWKKVCDAHLMPHVMVRFGVQNAKIWSVLMLGIWTVLTIAMAGPAFDKVSVGTVSTKQGLVIVLDMSPAMSEDKLFQAKIKLYDVLKNKKDDLIGFVMVDRKAYTVVPMTADHALIDNIIPTISKKVIPAIGSAPELGVERAGQLLKQSGFRTGQILLITGGVLNENKLMSAVRSSPYAVSILGIGEAGKTPAPFTDGTFWEKEKGSPYLTTLTPSVLGADAAFSFATIDDADLQKLVPDKMPFEATDSEHTVDIYRDVGIYLVWAMIPFVLIFFRRGVLWVVLMLIIASPVQANPFERQEQTSYRLSQKGVDAYRAQQYNQAITFFEQTQTADGWYNAGNAYAYGGQIDKAIAAYEQALSLNPDHADAAYNLEYLKQQSEQNQSQSEDQNNADEENQEASENQEGSGDTQQNENPSSEEEPKEEPSSGEEPSQPQPQPQSSSGHPQEEGEERPISEQSQKQQEWLDRVQSDPGRLLKYRLYRQYKEQTS